MKLRQIIQTATQKTVRLNYRDSNINRPGGKTDGLESHKDFLRQQDYPNISDYQNIQTACPDEGTLEGGHFHHWKLVILASGCGSGFWVRCTDK